MLSKMKTRKLGKKADLLHTAIMQIILIALIFVLFFGAATVNVNSRGVKQQVLQKQTALFIDAAEPGTTIILTKSNKYGTISNMKIEKNQIFIYVNDQTYSKGYPYFSRYQINLESDANYYYIKIK